MSEFHANFLVIDFLPTRTGFNSAEVIRLPVGTAVAVSTMTGSSLTIAFSKPIPIGWNLSIQFPAESEPTEVQTASWLEQLPGIQEEAVEGGTEARGKKTWLEYVERRERHCMLAAVQDRDLLFFDLLDAETHPDLIPHNPCLAPHVQIARSEAVSDLSKGLFIRLVNRVHYAGQDNGWAEDFGVKLKANHVRLISSVFVEISRKAFGSDAVQSLETLGVQFGEALVKFANGDFRDITPPDVWTAEPDSGYFFLFGEIAFAAVAVGADVEFWEASLLSLLVALRVFTKTYGADNPASRTLRSYGPRQWRPCRVISEDNISIIRRRLESENLTQVFPVELGGLLRTAISCA